MVNELGLDMENTSLKSDVDERSARSPPPVPPLCAAPLHSVLASSTEYVRLEVRGKKVREESAAAAAFRQAGARPGGEAAPGGPGPASG